MLKTLLLAILFALCCAPAFGQEKYRVTAEYDRFKDVTTYGLEPMPTSEATTFFFALYQCPGQTACRPDGVIFGFALVTLTDAPYEGQGMARAIRDGIRQDPYQLKYVGLKTKVVALLPAHVFMAMLRPDSVAKIAGSKLVEYQIDSLEFKLTPDNLAGLREFIGRMKSQ